MLADLAETLSSPGVTAAIVAIGVLLVLVLAVELRNVPPKLLVLMLTAFVDMAGLFLVVPVLPFMVQRLTGDGVSLGGLALQSEDVLGWVTSSFTLAQLVSSPLWGRYSDRRGRKAALQVALIASAGAYLLFGFAESLWVLLLSRVVQGAGGGTVGIIQAYVTDSVPPEQRARALGWLSAATNLGVAFGPVIGAQAVALGRLDLLPGDGEFRMGHCAVGVVAAALCLLNLWFAVRWLEEPSDHRPQGGVRPSVRRAIGSVLLQPTLPVSRVILIYALAIGTTHAINPQLALFLGKRFAVDEHTIGYVYMYIGALSVFVRVLVLGRVVDRWGEVRVALLGLVCLVLFLLRMPFVESLGGLAATLALLPTGMALTFPCTTSLLSRLVPTEQRGTYLGIQQSFAGTVRIAGPAVYGHLFAVAGAQWPFWIAAAVVSGSALLMLSLGRVVRGR